MRPFDWAAEGGCRRALHADQSNGPPFRLRSFVSPV